MKRLAIALAAAAMLGAAVPANAQGLYVGFGDGYYGGWGGYGYGSWGPGTGPEGYASYGWGPGFGYGWGGPAYSYAWGGPAYTYTYARPRPRASVYAYDTGPRYRYRRSAYRDWYGAYGAAGFGYRDWSWGW